MRKGPRDHPRHRSGAHRDRSHALVRRLGGGRIRHRPPVHRELRLASDRRRARGRSRLAAREHRHHVEFENVRLEPTDGDAIELEYWTGNCQSVSVEDADGVLKIDVDSQPMEGRHDRPLLLRQAASTTHDRGSRARVVHRRDRGTLRFGRRRRDRRARARRAVRLQQQRYLVAKNVSAAKLDAISTRTATPCSPASMSRRSRPTSTETSRWEVLRRKAQVVNENGDIMLVDTTLQDDLLCESVNGASLRRGSTSPLVGSSVNGDIYLVVPGGRRLLSHRCPHPQATSYRRKVPTTPRAPLASTQ